MISEYENTENVYTLSEFAGEGEEIPDPYGKPLTAYGECFEVLKRLIDQLEEKLNSFATRRRIMSKVQVMDHPLIQHKISYIRSEEVGSKEFREIDGEIAH